VKFSALSGHRTPASRGIDVRTAGLEVLDGLWDEVKRGDEEMRG
jgi:hypothetical protein